MLTDKNVTPSEDLRANALAEIAGTNAIVEETTETQESEVETTVATEEETEETEQEQSPEQEQPPKEDKTKKLYKALGKKDKRIAELEALIAEKSSWYDADSLSLINAIARKQALEHESESKEEQEREAFLWTLPKNVRESIEEDLEQNPQSWRIAQKLYSPATPKPKSKLGITGNSNPPPVQDKPLTSEELRALARKDFMQG